MHVMQLQPAVAETTARHAATAWVVRTSGLAHCTGGPGVAVAIVDSPDGGARTLIRRKEACSTLALELLAVIDGIEAALLDAALTVAPQDSWRIEIRTQCERVHAMIAQRDMQAADPAGDTPQPLTDRLVDLLADIADMGGEIAILHICAAATAPADALVLGVSQAELERHLARRAASVVLAFPTDRTVGRPRWRSGATDGGNACGGAIVALRGAV